MKFSKLKEVVLVKDKVYLYITPDDVYIRIDKIEGDNKLKIHKIKKLVLVQFIRNLFKKVSIKKYRNKVLNFKNVDKDDENTIIKK